MVKVVDSRDDAEEESEKQHSYQESHLSRQDGGDGGASSKSKRFEGGRGFEEMK